jgi:hypothetical protein
MKITPLQALGKVSDALYIQRGQQSHNKKVTKRKPLRYLLQDTEMPDPEDRSGIGTSASPIAVVVVVGL